LARGALVLALLLASSASAAPRGGRKVPLRDLIASFEKGASRVLRSRTTQAPGLFVGGVQLRGLNVPARSRIGFDLDARFSKLTVWVGVLDGGKGPLRFSVVGRGKTLVSTPPLFPGVAPVKLEVPLDGVLLLELVTEGEGASRGAWIDGELVGAPGKDLGRFLATDASFDPRAYPAAFRARVNRAIEQGKRFLLANQEANGRWNGHGLGNTALATLALLKAGVRPDAPEILRAFDQLRAWKPNHTYTCAVLLMALEARYFPGGHLDRTAAVDRPKLAKKLIPKADQQWIATLAKWLVEQQGAGHPGKTGKLYPVWRYPHGGYDLSNTQYALLGLSAARRCGYENKLVWIKALRFLLGAQEKEGVEVEVSRYFRSGASLRRRTQRAEARGFSYVLQGKPTAAMTTAGLCTIVLCTSALQNNVKYRTTYHMRARHSIRDALAWLEEYYDIHENVFQPNAWWTYYLFNLERVGVLLDQRYIGTRDWYHDGALRLLAAQNKSGRFAGGVTDTCFALLFLKRATVPARTSPIK